MKKGLICKLVLNSLLFTTLLLFGLPVGSAGALQVVQAADYKNLTPVDSGDSNTSYWDDVKWAVYDCDSDGVVDTLVLSGKGEIARDVYNAKFGQYKSYDLTLIIEEGITGIAASTFSSMNLVGDITFPKSLKEIGMNAFKSCTKLNGTIAFASPSSLTEIGTYAFAGCSKLSGVVLPDSLTSLGYYAFQNCSSLTGTVTMPQKLKTIDTATFFGCGKLESINFGNVTTIKESAFYNCKSLSGGLVLPKSLTSIEQFAFGGCTGLSGKPVIISYDSAVSMDSNTFTGTNPVVYNLSSQLALPESSTYTLGTVYTIKKIYADNSILERKFLPPGACDELTQYHQFPYPEYDGERDWYQDANRTNPVSKGAVAADATYYEATSDKKSQAELKITSASSWVYDIGANFTLSTTGGSGSGTVTYSVPDNKVLSITGAKASIMGVGTVTVTAVKEGDSTYKQATATQTFTVSPKSITSAMVGQIADQQYTGQQISPTVEVKDGTTTLVVNTDYEITYSNNINVCDKSASNAPTVTIKGKGNYTGTVPVKFTIKRAKAVVTITNSNITKSYGDDPFLLQGISKTGNGALVYTVKSGKDVISVSADGTVTIYKVGSAVIGVTTEGTTEYEPADEKTINITISECNHTGGTADCSHKAVCSRCGNQYGEFDYTRHNGDTEIRGKEEATCAKEGYTGDTYCKGCGNKTKSGEKIAKTEHQWDSGVVIQEATASKDGQKR